MTRGHDGELHAPTVEERVGSEEQGIAPLTGKRCERGVDLAAGAGVEDIDFFRPRRRAAASTSRTVDSARTASAGLTSNATRVAMGKRSRRNPSRLAASSAAKKVMPVTFPPGWLRLATRPSPTGSAAVENTIGIVVVAVLAASAAGVMEVVITATLRRIKAATSSGNRSYSALDS